MKCIKIDTNKLVPLQPYKIDFKELGELISAFESDGNTKTVSPIDIKQESRDEYSVLRGVDTALLCHIYGRETLAYLWESLAETEQHSDPELIKQFSNSRLNLQRTREIGIYTLADLLDIKRIKDYVANKDSTKKQVKKILMKYYSTQTPKMNTNPIKYDSDRYSFEVYWPSSDPMDPDNEAVDLIVRLEGREYIGTLTTQQFIDEMFDKNAKTGECADGSYFCMPKMIIVRKIDMDTIKKTLDTMLEDLEFGIFFEEY